MKIEKTAESQFNLLSSHYSEKLNNHPEEVDSKAAVACGLVNKSKHTAWFDIPKQLKRINLRRISE